jgi:hypothetical protein
VPFTTLLRVAVGAAYANLAPEGGQGRSRRNAADAVAVDRLRARARQEAWIALEARQPDLDRPALRSA